MLKKSLSALLRGLASNHNREFYCLNCFNSYSTEKRLGKHEKECYDHDDCDKEIPNEDNKILEYKHVEKPLRAPFMVPADLEFLLEKIHSCQNNHEKYYTEKKAKHSPSGSFDASKNKLGYYRVKNFMERFCKECNENN